MFIISESIGADPNVKTREKVLKDKYFVFQRVVGSVEYCGEAVFCDREISNLDKSNLYISKAPLDSSVQTIVLFSFYLCLFT